MQMASHDLVVGVDSMVGGALLRRLKRGRTPVVGTSRRPGRPKDSIFLDLSDDLSGWNPPGGVQTAFLCAGVTRLQACSEQPIASAKINVEGILQIARKLRDQGAFVVFLSSNQVFDGTVACRKESDFVCPTTEYGRQKAEAERQLRDVGAVDAVVRFTKILGAVTPLFLDWTAALRRNESIRAFSDMTFAPVPLSFVTSVLQLVGVMRLSGTFHVSGDRDVSYLQAALAGAKALGLNGGLVSGVDGAGEVLGDALHRHTTLEMENLRTALGIVPPGVDWTIETAFSDPEKLAVE
jgi:dTDP-4-dehydrorhamnose reductase